MIWTADPEAVTGEQLLSFVPASRISLDPIAAAARVGRGVEADAVVVLPGDAGLVCSYFAVAAETTMPEARATRRNAVIQALALRPRDLAT